MRFLRTVRSTGLLFLAVLMLSVDSGVFAAPSPIVGRQSSLSSAAKQNVIEKLGEEVVCEFCKLVVKLVQSIFESSVSEDFVADVVTKACETFEIEDEYICSTITQEFKEEVLYIFAHTALSSDEICGALVGEGCGTTMNPFNQTWFVPIPGGKPPLAPFPVPDEGAPKNRILHLTDFHWDPKYTPGLVTNCGEPLCCRPPNPKATNADDAAPYWGYYTCDPPLRTIESMLDHINKTAEFDWIYWTGDNPSHSDWDQTREDALEALNTMASLLKKYFPNKLVFSAMGNHDSAPVNSFPPPYVTDKEVSDEWLLKQSAKQWSQLNGDPTTQTTINYAGYYATTLTPDLKIIALETNYCYQDNWWMLMNSTDPGHELEWFIQELLESEKKGQKVHVIGHIPPYSNDCLASWSYNWYKIANRFEGTIVGHFFGHRHEDRFGVLYEEKTNRPFGVVHMAPSVTPYQWLNMGYRIYTIDGNHANSSRVLIDHETYYMDLHEAKNTNTTNWKYEYSAKAAYNLTSMSAKEWANLTDRFKTDDSLFQQFYKYYSKSFNSGGGCSGNCKKLILEDMHQSYSGNTPPPLVKNVEMARMWRLSQRNRHC